MDGTRGMAWLQEHVILALLLILVSISSGLSSDDFNKCESIVKIWAESSKVSGIKEDKFTLKDLLFFLHVPRTGGRTYFYCFLSKLYTDNQECPRSYDRLHFNPRKSNCRLMVTHDDYSLMSKLPKDRTSVVTILRNPIDRIFSTYEFAVEVAARFLVHPNLTSVKQTLGRVRSKDRGTSTLDIWPWKYLVPWMREDLFTRRDARKYVKSRRAKNADISPYDMEDMVMTLQAFINDPIAHEIIHNGATFQVAGITNNSNIHESHEVRLCVRKHPALGRYVLDVAKNRLDHMLYVGLTENHKGSATMFANMVGAQVLSQSEALSSLKQKPYIGKEIVSTEDTDNAPNQVQHSTDSLQAGEIQSPVDAVSKSGNMTVEALMKTYENCTSSLRKSQGSRRYMSLKRIAPANFSKESRLLVPEDVLQEILSLNSLDVELYKHAQGIFLQQQKHLMQTNQNTSVQQHVHVSSQADMEGLGTNMQTDTHQNMFSLIILAFMMVIVILLIVTVKRRSSKLKV